MRDPVRHVSVLALLQAHPGRHDARELIRTLARAKVAAAMSKGWTGPPFCPHELCSLFGIRCREVQHDIGGEGRLLLRKGGPWIEYRCDRPPERQRFTIFHEFAHTLFPDYCEFVRHHANEDLSKADTEFENLCDVAAAEMLFPSTEFCRDLASGKLTLAALHELRRLYGASLDATTHRAVECEPTVPCAAAFLTDQRGAFSGGGPLWVKYARHGRLFHGFVWPGTEPPAGSVAIACYQTADGLISQHRETWVVRGRRYPVLAEAAKLPPVPSDPAYSKVVTLLVQNPERETLRG